MATADTQTAAFYQGPPPPFRPCWHCHYFDGWTAQGLYVLCKRAGCSRVRSGPATGCTAWEREPGSDDEPGLTWCDQVLAADIHLVPPSTAMQQEVAVVVSAPALWVSDKIKQILAMRAPCARHVWSMHLPIHP